jgi:hsp70-interacting protein
MKMWKQLQDLLTSPKSSPNITKQTLWVIGTALQNSPESQDAVSVPSCLTHLRLISAQYLTLKPIPTILKFLDLMHTSQTRSKAVYALSGLLKHNKAAVNGLGDVGGWKVLKYALAGSVHNNPQYLFDLIPFGGRLICDDPPQNIVFN